MPGTALGFGDLSRGHFIGDIGAAHGGVFMSANGGEIEPLVRFDQVALGTVASGREGDAKIEAGVKVSVRSSGKAACDQQVWRRFVRRHAGAGRKLLAVPGIVH